MQNLLRFRKRTPSLQNGAGDKEEIAARIAQIKKQIEETTSSFDKEKLQERLAKLAGGVAVVRVGAATENRDERGQTAYGRCSGSYQGSS